MSSLKEFIALLDEALRDPLSREKSVGAFQRLVWDSPKQNAIGREAFEILADLAYDLDFFEPDPVVRMTDPSYYGNERLESEIKAAFRHLAKLGISIPYDPSSSDS